MSRFRHGQWVLFTPASPIPGAHVLPDGRHVGIYQRAARPMAAVAASGAALPPGVAESLAEHIVAVDESGANCMVLVRGEAKVARVDPATCSTVEPLTDPAHVPPGREVHPEWVPHP